jgi:hypothetical protein
LEYTEPDSRVTAAALASTDARSQVTTPGAGSVTLYVCYGTFGPAERHACANAAKALEAAGHHPRIVKTYGCYGTDRLFKGRREVKRMTGNHKVPTLVLDDGEIVDGSQRIVAWSAANPA